jgi:hypothetical protein
MSRKLVQFVCVFMLLFTQQVALTHATWHAHGAAPAEHGKGKPTLQGDLCSLHGLFSQVLGGAPAAVFHADADDVAVAEAAQLETHCIVARLNRPRSRSPPSLA